MILTFLTDGKIFMRKNGQKFLLVLKPQQLWNVWTVLGESLNFKIIEFKFKKLYKIFKNSTKYLKTLQNFKNLYKIRFKMLVKIIKNFPFIEFFFSLPPFKQKFLFYSKSTRKLQAPPTPSHFSIFDFPFCISETAVVGISSKNFINSAEKWGRQLSIVYLCDKYLNS